MVRLIYDFPQYILGIVTILSAFPPICEFIKMILNKEKGKFPKITLTVTIVFLILFLGSFLIKDHIVSIPNVVNLTYTQAKQVLDEHQIKFDCPYKVNNPNTSIIGYQSFPENHYIFKWETLIIATKDNYHNSSENENNGIINGNNNILQQGDGVNIVNNDKNFISIDGSSSIKTDDEGDWNISLLNEVDSPIEIGNDLLLDFVFNTPPSQYSSPYVLYCAYLDEKNNWIQIRGINIPAGQSHVKLTIDTYKLGLKPGAYIFTFDLFRADDFTTGNSCIALPMSIRLIGENATFTDDIFYRGVVSYEFLDYVVIQDNKYSVDTEKLCLNNVDDLQIRAIGCLNSLKELSISGSKITNIEPLKDLKQLEILSVHSNNLEDISAVKKMTNLISLSIGGENRSGVGTHGVLEDVSPVKNLNNLKCLEIYDCNVKKIECIGNLKVLRTLCVYNTKVKDISSISNLRFLEVLRLHGNSITDLSSLSELYNLNSLTLSYNKITDITPLQNLDKLSYLTLKENKISNKQIEYFKETHPDCLMVV